MRLRFLAVALLALGACSKLVPVPDPSAEDGKKAMLQVLNALQTPAKLYYPVGTPTSCQSGTLNGQDVRSCKVCGFFLIAQTGMFGIQRFFVRRANYDIPFKRAISYEQPDIAPTGTGGVWAAAMPAPGALGQQSMPTAPTSIEYDLTPADMQRFGISMGRGLSGGYNFSVQRPGYIGVIPNANVLLDTMKIPAENDILFSLVNKCE
jgi:hypothetical protein